MASVADEAAPALALEPVERPDRAKFDAEVAALNQEIFDHQKRR